MPPMGDGLASTQQSALYWTEVVGGIRFKGIVHMMFVVQSVPRGFSNVMFCNCYVLLSA